MASTLVGLYLGDPPADRLRLRPRPTDEKRYAALFHALLDRGVALAPGAYEVMFPGLAHTDDIIAEVGTVAVEAARDAA